MDPLTIMALVNAALAFVEQAAPHVEKLFESGEISEEDQKALNDRITALENKHFAFTRPGEGDS